MIVADVCPLLNTPLGIRDYFMRGQEGLGIRLGLELGIRLGDRDKARDNGDALALSLSVAPWPYT